MTVALYVPVLDGMVIASGKPLMPYSDVKGLLRDTHARVEKLGTSFHYDQMHHERLLVVLL